MKNEKWLVSGVDLGLFSLKAHRLEGRGQPDVLASSEHGGNVFCVGGGRRMGIETPAQEKRREKEREEKN